MVSKTLFLVLLCLSVDKSFQQGFSKLLVATGRKGTLTSVEVLNLEDPAQTCENLPDLPSGLKGPTGQLFNKTTPIICGGVELEASKDLCECFAFVEETVEGTEDIGKGEWITHSSPAQCGPHAKSVSLTAGDNPENEEKNDLWLVTGGLVGSNPLSRVETFDGQSWSPTAVKNLPVSVYLHCLVKLNDTVLFLIGGTTSDENASGHTFAYDNRDNTWTRGPILAEPRSGHACGLLKTEAEHYIVVAGGSTGSNYAATVELLKISPDGVIATEWVAGPALPQHVLFGSMVEYNGSVILIGGGGEDLTNATLPISFDGDQLFQLKSPEGPWVELGQKLKEKRSQHTSFLIPDELAKCQ